MRASAVAVAILAAVALAALLLQTPVRSIVPYAVAVGIVSYATGAAAGLLTAAAATLVAALTGAFPTSGQWAGQEWAEGIATMARLAAIVPGVIIGKRLYARYPAGPLRDRDG